MSADIEFNPDAVPVEEWPEPMPLAGVRYDPAPYPIKALPEGIRAAVKDVQRTTQAPLAMVATSALTALSLAGQAHIDVARNKHLTSPVSLFALVLAESGERKTTVDGFFTRPIREHETEVAEAMKPVIEDYKADLQSWDAEKKGVMAKVTQESKNGKDTAQLKERLRNIEKDKPEAPKVPQLLYGDVTPESLAYELAKTWPSAGVISSEAGTVFGSHGMGADSVMRNLAALNVLWDGSTHKVDRRTSESYSVDNARLTVSLQVQLPVLVEFMRKAGELARGSGFLARFLVAWPESTQGTRLYKEPDSDLAGLKNFHARLKQLLAKDMVFDDSGNRADGVMLKLSPEAKEVWTNFYNLIERQLAPNGELEYVRDVASKTADNAARIAALFHLHQFDDTEEISRESMESAVKVATWHLSESRRLLTELSQDPALSDAARLDEWLIKKCKEYGTNRLNSRYVLQHVSPIKLRKRSELTPVLNELISLDRVREIKEGSKKLIVVNPELLNGGG